MTELEEAKRSLSEELAAARVELADSLGVTVNDREALKELFERYEREAETLPKSGVTLEQVVAAIRADRDQAEIRPVETIEVRGETVASADGFIQIASSGVISHEVAP